MTIVVGYVPKPEGEAALERAVDEARLRSEDLVIVNASSGGSYADASYANDEQLQAVRPGAVAVAPGPPQAATVRAGLPRAPRLQLVGAHEGHFAPRHRSQVVVLRLVERRRDGDVAQVVVGRAHGESPLGR